MLIKIARLHVAEVIVKYQLSHYWGWEETKSTFPIWGFDVTAIYPQKIPGGWGGRARRIALSWYHWIFGFV